VLVGHGALYIPLRLCSLLDQSRKKSGFVGQQTDGLNFQEYLLSNKTRQGHAESPTTHVRSFEARQEQEAVRLKHVATYLRRARNVTN
jgi:hypothetical protein